MAFQPVIDTASIVIEYLQNGEPLINTLYAKKVGGYLLVDLNALAFTVDANVSSAWLPDQTLDCTYIKTTIRGLALENDLLVTNNTGTAPGGQIGTGLPNSVTISIKKTSGETGRSARGRTYWIGIPSTELDADENVVSATYVSTVVANMLSMRGSIEGGVWDPVLVSRFTGGVKRPAGKTFPWLSSEAVNGFVDSQRGRLKGR